MSAARRSWRALLPCAALVACAELPTIDADTCGNGVIELGEDCDGFSIYSQASCRKPGQVGQCHLDCSGDVKGEPSSCPQGWGCDVNAICRAPSGGFRAAQTHNIGAVAGLLSGDVDGDGRADIVSRAPLDRLVRSRLSFHFFDAQGRVEETREFAKPVSPWLGQLSADDQRADLVFSDTNIGLLLGRDDRRIVLETFSSYRVPDTRLRLTGVYDGNVSNGLSLVAFGTFDGQPGFSVPDLGTFLLRRVGTLADAIDSRTVPIPGDVIEGSASPCDEIALAVPDTSTFLLLDLCEPANDGQVAWRREALQHAIALIPPARLDGRALVADVNGDHHLDVLLGAKDDQGDERAYAAIGDGKGLRDAIPFVQRYWDAPRGGDVDDARLPLAVGDFSGDEWPDFVYATQLVSSMPTPMAGAPRYEVVSGNIGEPWTVAVVADVNGNDKNDVIVASQHTAGVDVFNGTGIPFLFPTTLPTEQPVQFLTVGDFDGDLTNDIAFVEQPVAGEDRASLSIAFGNVGRPPTDPRLVGTAQDVEQMSGFRQWARGNILLASAHGDPVAYSGIVTLEGTQDRVPFAPYQLVTFAQDGSFNGFPALHVLGGAFRGAAHRDVIALDSNSFSIQDPREQPVNRIWLLADIAQGEHLPVPVGELDPILKPQASAAGRTGLLATTQLQIASSSVDLDGDQRDEAVWAIPTEDGRCGISIISLSDDDPPKVIKRATLQLAQQCQVPTVASDDLNEDDRADLLLSSVRTDADGRELERTLWVLWNDGRGQFSPERMSRVDGDGDVPISFTTLPAVLIPDVGTIPRSIVYLTESGLTRKRWSERTQSFESESYVPALSLTAGRAITSGDYNGDGAFDLALADGNKLMVFLAELVAP